MGRELDQMRDAGLRQAHVDHRRERNVEFRRFVEARTRHG